jgi:kynureninase
MLITGWNKAGWMAQPDALGDRIGRLIGAPRRAPCHGGRHAVDQGLPGAGRRARDAARAAGDPVGHGNFPTDLYMAEGLIQALGQGP